MAGARPEYGRCTSRIWQVHVEVASAGGAYHYAVDDRRAMLLRDCFRAMFANCEVTLAELPLVIALGAHQKVCATGAREERSGGA